MGQQATRLSVRMQLLRHFIFKIIINYLVAYYIVGFICNKRQYFGHWCEEPSHWKRPWHWERLRTGGEGGSRRRDGWMASLTQWNEFEQTPGDDEGKGSPACCSPRGRKKSDTTEQLNNNKICKNAESSDRCYSSTPSAPWVAFIKYTKGKRRKKDPLPTQVVRVIALLYLLLLDGRESEWTPGVGDGQGGLACCDSWGRKESDTTERLNWIST